MALGNNLKRIKKDNLIPSKKKEDTVAKTKPPKTTTKKSKSAPQKNTKPKSAKPTKTQEKPVPKIVKTENNQPLVQANLTEKIIFGGTHDAPLTAKLIPSRRKTVRKTKLLFEGSMSINEADAIKDCLKTTFNDYDLIDIELLNITQLDIVPIQLINVFKNAYSNKKIKVDADLPFDIKLVVERAGFGKLLFKEEAA